MIVIVLLLSGCQRQRGTFDVMFSPAATPETQEIRRLLEEHGDFPRIAERLTHCLRSPEDVRIVFDDSHDLFYEEYRIVIGYGYLQQVGANLEKAGYASSPRERLGAVLAVAHFSLYHELAHALIEIFDLPVVGREEDAADGLATVIAIDLLEYPEIALAAALAFDAGIPPEAIPAERAYWGEHSLDGQRYYNILCWVHGSDPEGTAAMLKTLAPPEWWDERSSRCPREYERLVRSWMRLLEPHLRPHARAVSRFWRMQEEGTL